MNSLFKPPTGGPATPQHSPVFWAPALLAMVLGLLLTVAMWQLARGEAIKLEQAKTQARVQELQIAVQSRMAAHEQILRGGVSLINTLGMATRAQWANYVADLEVQKNYPGIHGIGYAEHVSLADRENFVARMRDTVAPQFEIRPSGQRESYGPVSYLEPRTERNLRALGFDMLSEPNRREAMLVARDTNTPAITAPLKLAAEPSASAALGFLIYLPVYRPGMPLDTVEQRRLALKGFVNSPFRTADFMRGILGSNNDHARLRIHDGTLSASGLMYEEPSSSSPGGDRAPLTGPSADERLTRVSMSIHHRTWHLEYLAQERHDWLGNHTAQLVLVSGGMISLLLGALTFSLTTRVQLMRRSALHYFQLASHDSLTGLPNRSKFQSLLQETLAQARQAARSFGVLFIDVDNFKEINDSLGHQAGDLVLQELAVRLRACVRPDDTVARLGGDEFTVILHAVHDAQDASSVASAVLAALSAPIQLAGGTCAPSVSIGISIFPTHASTTEDLLKSADKAMYAAKRNGRNQYQLPPAA